MSYVWLWLSFYYYWSFSYPGSPSINVFTYSSPYFFCTIFFVWVVNYSPTYLPPLTRPSNASPSARWVVSASSLAYLTFSFSDLLILSFIDSNYCLPFSTTGLTNGSRYELYVSRDIWRILLVPFFKLSHFYFVSGFTWPPSPGYSFVLIY